MQLNLQFTGNTFLLALILHWSRARWSHVDKGSPWPLSFVSRELGVLTSGGIQNCKLEKVDTDSNFGELI